MCLEIIASISQDAAGRISAGRLSEVATLAVSSRKIEGQGALHFAVTGGCSCEFLSDEAEFDSETWTLSPAHLPALASAVTSLTKECRKFSLLAHWLGGERPRRDQRISGAALAKLIAENRLGNNVLYVVG